MTPLWITNCKNQNDQARFKTQLMNGHVWKTVVDMFNRMLASKVTQPERIQYIYAFLKESQDLKIEMLAQLLRFNLCKIISERPVSLLSTLPADLKECGIVTLISNDGRAFFFPQEVAFLSPYLRQMCSSALKEGASKIVTLPFTNGASIRPLKKLMMHFYELLQKSGEFYLDKEMSSYYDYSHERNNRGLKKVLDNFADAIPIQAVHLADEWLLPSFAQLLMQCCLDKIQEDDIPEFIKKIHPSCHKYIAAELRPCCELLEWQIECYQDIIAAKQNGTQMPTALKRYAYFIIAHLERLFEMYPNLSRLLDTKNMSCIVAPLRAQLIESVLNLDSKCNKEIWKPVLESLTLSQLLELAKTKYNYFKPRQAVSNIQPPANP